MPAPDFTGFTGRTIAFLSDLEANNNREWFNANRPLYEAAVKKPANAFAELMAGEIESLTGLAQKPKIFRINRDIRFSRDKTPYNAHIHIAWTPLDAGASPPAFMFGLSTEYCTVGCGVFEFAAPALETYRRRIAGPEGDDLGRMVAALKDKGFRLQEPALKRIPAGFPPDHPYVELSLHKGIAVWRDFEGPQAAAGPDIMARSLSCFEELLPLWRFLRDLDGA
jgi:uncharacterized protein (TIGR02453 family)